MLGFTIISWSPEGIMRILCCFLLAASLGAHPVPFKKGEKWGYRDPGGKTVIAPRFEIAQEFSPEGIAAVVDGQGWAYIDTTGRVLIRPLIVDNGPDYFEEGLARFRAASGIGFFDKTGKIVIQARYAFAQSFSEGFAAVCDGCNEKQEGEHTAVEGGRWGFIDRQGTLIIPFQFEAAQKFENGRARVKSSGTWKYIDKKGAVAGQGSIGTAWMEEGGTIVLQLRAYGPGGMTGDALIRYPVTHPDYERVLRHLGGLKQGERKPVAPWPSM
jgi:hypothetical protein